MRPTWDETFFELAFTWSKRATCDRLHAGIVAVNDDHQVLAAGYNGAPRGMAHCDDVGHLMVEGHCVRTLHSEWNMLIQAVRTGVSLFDARVYVTARPCQICTKMMVQAGIREIKYWAPYNTDVGAADHVEQLCRAFAVPLIGPCAPSLEPEVEAVA